MSMDAAAVGEQAGAAAPSARPQATARAARSRPGTYSATTPNATAMATPTHASAGAADALYLPRQTPHRHGLGWPVVHSVAAVNGHTTGCRLRRDAAADFTGLAQPPQHAVGLRHAQAARP